MAFSIALAAPIGKRKDVIKGLPQLVIINDTEKRGKEAFREARCSYETTLYNKGMKTMSIPSAKEYIQTARIGDQKGSFQAHR